MKKNSVRMKELAEALGLSQGTISIVLNGKGDEMRISKETQERVLQAAKEMGYTFSGGAKSPRRRQWGNRFFVAVLIPYIVDVKIVTGRVLYGLQQAIMEEKLPVELLLHPYTYGKLENCAGVLSSQFCRGAIIMGMSEEDVSFLTENSFQVPIVLFNRPTEQHSSVYVDDYEAGRKVALLFKKRGHEKVGLIAPRDLSKAGSLRRMGFIDGCRRLSLQLKPENMREDYISSEGGARAARSLLEGTSIPTAVFVQMSDMAVGAARAFQAAGLRVPEDMEIVSYGGTMEEFTTPSLSAVRMPVEEMSAECLRILLGQMQEPETGPIARILPLTIDFRESCGGFPEAL